MSVRQKSLLELDGLHNDFHAQSKQNTSNNCKHFLCSPDCVDIFKLFLLIFYLYIRHLQKQGPEEGKLKYITGEWFYEAKSQRHQDRIHGSDIIMASMKQKKPMTLGEFHSIKHPEISSVLE